MKCPKCGRKGPDNWEFCPDCGIKMIAVTKQDKHIFYAKAVIYFILLFIFPYIVIPLSVIYIAIKLYKDYKLEHTNPVYIQKRIEREQAQQRYQQWEKNYKIEHINDPAHCPRCHSTQVAPVNQKSSFSLGKAVGGTVLVGGIGALAGFAGSNKNKIMCMKCGHTWKP
jgi:hypothetical protein